MSIEYRCGRCSKLLRVPEETAGKQARCPQCGQISRVPGSLPDAAAASPFAGSADSAPGAEIRGKVVTAGPNPYQSPGGVSIEAIINPFSGLGG